MMLTNGQRIALYDLGHYPMERSSDGRWRPIGGQEGHRGHADEDIGQLGRSGYAAVTQLGAVITEAGRDWLKRSGAIIRNPTVGPRV